MTFRRWSERDGLLLPRFERQTAVNEVGRYELVKRECTEGRSEVE